VTHDPINSPSHYAEGRKYEPIAVIEDWRLNYRLGNAVKYVSRAGRKDPAKTIEDLKKAAWYIEREIQALESAKKPYSVSYQDVLQDAAYEAANGFEPLYEYGVTVPQADVDDSHLPFWDSDEDYMWDPTLGPIELTDSEVDRILSKRNLDLYEGDEIVTSVERRGMVIGVKKDGSTCLLNDQGRCI
jgi:hypothetical protein